MTDKALEAAVEALADLIEVADGTLAMLDAKRKRGEFNHWESFELCDFAVSIHRARAVLRALEPKP